uniref:Methyltransferase domain-containing protein n=1 Tax=Meloidogyne incognita TaxID=6306 RepID=A0A914KWW7_MELIC
MLKFLPEKFALLAGKELNLQYLGNILKFRYQKFMSGAMRDIRLQFMCPTSSLLGYVVTKMEARSTKPIYSMLISDMNLRPDDYILEVGFGRGNGVDLILERIFPGNGQYYGIELSNYMADITSSEMLDDITRTKAMFSQIGMFNFLPYNTDFFDSLFHIDVFYAWDNKYLKESCDEFYRVLKPGCHIFCAMDMQKLHRLAKYRILSKFDYDPLRYIETLEHSGFGCVKLDYKRIDKNGNLISTTDRKSREILLIQATKPFKEKEEILPDKILEALETEIKTELDEIISKSSISGQSKEVLNQRRNLLLNSNDEMPS